MYKKIITHEGVHHADELLAIAFIQHLQGDLPIERTYTPTEADFNNPEIIILDIGRRLEPELSNFDHHQSGDIPATNLLVLEHFMPGKLNEFSELLKKHLFGYVDAVDRGHIIERPGKDFSVPTFNSIIRNLNNTEDGFDIALQFAKAALRSAIDTVQKEIGSRAHWEKLEKQGGIAIQHDVEHIVGWHELAEKDGVLLLVFPNVRQEGSYRITSRDTNILRIPKHEKQIFLHANRFTASYPDLESAVNHAVEIIASFNYNGADV